MALMAYNLANTNSGFTGQWMTIIDFLDVRQYLQLNMSMLLVRKYAKQH